VLARRVPARPALALLALALARLALLALARLALLARLVPAMRHNWASRPSWLAARMVASIYRRQRYSYSQ
jgi:hypothetical protein